MAKNKAKIVALQRRITKQLQKDAKEVDMKVKPMLRDKLEELYIKNVYASYAPISEHGKTVKAENEYAKKVKGHMQASPYHHTGTFVSSIHGVIEDDVVKIKIEDKLYDDGTSTLQVYEWLTKGTTKTPKKNSYPYVKKQGDKYSASSYSTGWAKYNPTPKHKFEEITLEEFRAYINNELLPEITYWKKR